MILSKKFLFLIALLCFFVTFNAKAQHNYIVHFNEKGQITDSLPSLLTNADTIRFDLISSPEGMEQRVTNAYLLYLQIIKNLDEKDKTDKTASAVLVNAGLEDEPHAKAILIDLQAMLADRLLKFLKVPENAAIIAKTRSLEADRRLLKKYRTNKEVDDYNLEGLNYPSLESLINVSYSVHYGFKRGFNPAIDSYPCPANIELSKVKGECCLFKWSSVANESEDFKKYKFVGAFSNPFTLRQHNLNLQIYNAQSSSLFKLHALAADIDYSDLTTAINKKFDDLAKDSTYKGLLTWLKSKYQGKEDKSAEVIAVNSNATVRKALVDAIKSLVDDEKKTIHTNSFYDFMFGLSWLTQGKSLSANPVAIPPKPDAKKELGKVTDSISAIDTAEKEISGRTALVQNASKSTVAGCCNTSFINILDNKYQSLQVLKDTLDKLKTRLKKEKDSLTNVPAAYAKSLAGLDQVFYKDSLLYAGIFVINAEQNRWLHPNLPGYNYLRNHNALNDVHHFDLHIRRNINETQQTDIFAINSDRNAKYALVTTSADLSPYDFFSMQIDQADGKAVAPGAPADKTIDASLQAVYKSYKDLFNYVNLFKNGVIDSSFTEKEDTSADYVSRWIKHTEPDVPGKATTYQITDPVSKKNLNSEGWGFSYNYDNLVRFSFKAGIAYSWLNRRTYVINQAANTATYTDAYAGLAPAIGFQVYTSKIDMKSQRFLPVSLYPFLYVGYMFHDTPANNFLFGGGFELISGVSIIGGVHLGKTQGLTLEQGNLLEKDYYKVAPFISLSVGIEAFKTIFSSSTLTDPSK